MSGMAEYERGLSISEEATEHPALGKPRRPERAPLRWVYSLAALALFPFCAGATTEMLAGVLNDAWSYDPDTDRWQQITPANSGVPGFYQASSVYDPLHDRVLVFGRLNSNGAYTAWEEWRSDKA